MPPTIGGDAGEGAGHRSAGSPHGQGPRWALGRPGMSQLLLAVLVISALWLFRVLPSVSDGPGRSRFMLWAKEGDLVKGVDKPRVYDSGDGYVEVMHAGWYARLPVALNISLWRGAGVVYDDPRASGGSYARAEMLKGVAAGAARAARVQAGTNGGGSKLHLPEPDVPLTMATSGLHVDMDFATEQCPTGSIRVLIGITTKCCGSLAVTNREAIRKTWMQKVNDQYSDYLDARFFISQPGTRKQFLESYHALRGEVKLNNDVVVLPGEEDDLELPRKSLELLQYAVESPCRYTHIMKVSDECYLKADNLLKMIRRKQPELDTEDSPWMENMLIGELGGNYEVHQAATHDSLLGPKMQPSKQGMADSHGLPGRADLLGWGFMMSRDKAEEIVQRVQDSVEDPHRRTRWWALLPWEDTLVGVMLAGTGNSSGLRYHPGFKSAWNSCPEDTVVKHLDVDAPEFQYRLYRAEQTNAWSSVSASCSAGTFAAGDYNGWKAWRDTLPDSG